MFHLTSFITSFLFMSDFKAATKFVILHLIKKKKICLKIDYLQFPVEHISQLMLLCVDTVIYLSYMYRDLLWSDHSGKSFRSTHMANWMFVQCYSFEPLRSIQIYTHIYIYIYIYIYLYLADLQAFSHYVLNCWIATHKDSIQWIQKHSICSKSGGFAFEIQQRKHMENEMFVPS